VRQGRKKIYQAKCPPKQAGVAILISDKVDFKAKLVRRNKEGYLILINGVIHQNEITIVKLYVPNVSEPNFIKHLLLDLKTQIHLQHSNSGKFNTPLS
jgi:hypothetical protein